MEGDELGHTFAGVDGIGGASNEIRHDWSNGEKCLQEQADWSIFMKDRIRFSGELGGVDPTFCRDTSIGQTFNRSKWDWSDV